MSKVLDRAGLGADISSSQNDSNLSSLSGINEAQTATSYTMTIDDQNRTIEHSNASAIAVTLTAISTINSALHTDDFKCTHKNIGAGLVTLTCGGSDTFDDGATTLTLTIGQSVDIQTDSTGAIWNVIDHGRRPVSGTVQASTSGTEIDFTGIPSWAKKITLSYAGVSTDSTTALVARLGDSGGFETTGYDSNVTVGQSGSNSSTVNATTYLHLSWGAAASRTHLGVSTFVLLDSSTNTWIQSGIDADTAASTAIMATTAGSKSLSGTLTQLRISTLAGSETFDAGKINILIE